MSALAAWGRAGPPTSPSDSSRRNAGRPPSRILLRRRGLAAWLLLPLLAGPAFEAAAQTTETFISNLGKADQSSEHFLNFDYAQQFTTGSNSLGYSLRSVEVEFERLATPFTVSVKIYSDSSESPGSSVGTLTNPTFTNFNTDTVLTFKTTGIDLDANTKYHVVLDVASTLSTRIHGTNSNDEDSGGLAGWSIGDIIKSRPAASTGSDWSTAGGGSMKIRLKGVTKTPTLPTVSITPKAATAVTEGTGAVFTVTRTGATTSALEVKLHVDDAPNSDFVAGTAEGNKTVTITTGNASADYTVPTVGGNSETADEPNGPVKVTIREDATKYTRSATMRSATRTVNDNDATPVTLAGTTTAINEGGAKTFTVSIGRGLYSGERISVPLSFTGTAQRGTSNDYTLTCASLLPKGVTCSNLNSGTATVLFTGPSTGQSATSVILTLTARADGTTESSGETVNVNLGSVTVTGSGGGVTTTDNFGQFTINDPPTPVVSITGGSAVTEGGTASFTLTATPAPAGSITVNVNVVDSGSFATSGQAGSRTVTMSTSGTATLTVATQDDGTDEPNGTFTATVQAGSGYSPHGTNGSATVTVNDNDDPPAADVRDVNNRLPGTWLPRFGRTVAEQALDGIAGRLEVPRTPGLQGALAGQSLETDSGLPAGAVSGGQVAAALSGFVGGVHAGRSGVHGLLLGSHFNATGAAGGGSLAFWGRASHGSFDGREGSLSLDGEATGVMLGADYAQGQWLFGLALTHSEGDGDYADHGGAVRDGTGEIDISLTAVLPYAAYQASEHLKVWGAMGFGSGEVRVKPGPGGRHRADTDWRMAAAGAKGELLAPAGAEGMRLALVSDALWTRTDSDRTRGLAASESDTTRLRVSLEGSWALELDGSRRMTPRLALGARHDDGDAETGLGVEFGGGIAWSDPARGLSLDLSGRTLLAHGDDDLEDRGFSGTLAFDPTPGSRRGPSFSLRQEFGGQADGGLEALFAPGPLRAQGGGELSSRWAMEAAWGFPALGGDFVAGPHVGFGLASETRDWTLGWRLEPDRGHPSELSLGLTATLREGGAAGAAIGVDLGMRW